MCAHRADGAHDAGCDRLREGPETNIISKIPKGLWNDALKASAALRSAKSVHVATHIDADGISAAAIAKLALERMGIKVAVSFHKKLDQESIAELKSDTSDIVWLTDLGSGSLSKLDGLEAIVSDHHVPDPNWRGRPERGQMALSDFASVRHVNPQAHGLSGANELSGAGATYLVAHALDGGNRDLLPLAILGAIGDLQDQTTRRLEGLNRVLLDAATALGLIEVVQDIRYFGRETRPVHKMLEFSSDPYIPRITGSEEGAIAFLLELGIELKDGDEWRAWTDLSKTEKERIISELKELLLASKRRQETVDRLVGEVYIFTREARRTPLRDVKEYATLLNACGRHGKGEVALRICTGDRGDALSEGMTLLRDHRSAISKALQWAKGSGIVRMKNIQFFDAGDEIEDTIVGTVAGMLLNGEGADRSVPMVAFAESTEYSDEPKLKASARGTREMVSNGLDLAVAMRSAAEKVGGVGGGHNIAAGATIPAARRDEFLQLLDGIVGAQVVRRARPRG